MASGEDCVPFAAIWKMVCVTLEVRYAVRTVCATLDGAVAESEAPAVPDARMFPTTSKAWLGLVVPMPTMPEEDCTVKLPGPVMPPAKVLVAVDDVAVTYGPMRAPLEEMPATEREPAVSVPESERSPVREPPESGQVVASGDAVRNVGVGETGDTIHRRVRDRDVAEVVYLLRLRERRGVHGCRCCGSGEREDGRRRRWKRRDLLCECEMQIV